MHPVSRRPPASCSSWATLPQQAVMVNPDLPCVSSLPAVISQYGTLWVRMDPSRVYATHDTYQTVSCHLKPPKDCGSTLSVWVVLPRGCLSILRKDRAYSPARRRRPRPRKERDPPCAVFRPFPAQSPFPSVHPSAFQTRSSHVRLGEPRPVAGAGRIVARLACPEAFGHAIAGATPTRDATMPLGMPSWVRAGLSR